jgi:hypothetical protein
MLSVHSKVDLHISLSPEEEYCERTYKAVLQNS